jgi:hypothetical protein
MAEQTAVQGTDSLPADTPGSLRWWARGAIGRRPDTLEDMRLYVEGGFVPVVCASCATRVMVKKNSAKHTSVQWMSDAATSCPEIGAQVAAGARGAQILGCGRLRESIEAAVRSGAVTVPDE